MTKKKNKNRAKRTKQATKDYGVRSGSKSQENIYQLTSSYRGDNTRSNPSYSNTAFASEILDLSREMSSTPVEMIQSENNLESKSEKIEGLSSDIVNDLIVGTNANLAIEKKVCPPPAADENKSQQVTDTSPLLAAMSFWQSYTNTWIRAYSKLFMFGD
jgi:hypothetical protein